MSLPANVGGKKGWSNHHLALHNKCVHVVSGKTNQKFWNIVNCHVINAALHGTKQMMVKLRHCRRPIILCTVHEYFWHAQRWSDAIRVTRPDC